jgi:hypothetical protein
MKSVFPLFVAAAFACSTFVASAQHATHATATPASAAATVAAPKLQATLRALWRGHVAQTRAYALAVKAGNTKRARKAESDVVANAQQISGAVAGFYGKAAGDHMLTLLAGHWGAVKQMTDSVKLKDTAGNTRALETLTTNAREIAGFLSGANPHLPQDAVFGLLAAHSAHHSAQISQVMKGDMKAEAATWRAMQAHMDTIADALTQALAKQFPSKAA